MARVSFSLRRTNNSRGSYVRYDVGTYDIAASAGNAELSGSWAYSSDRDFDTTLRSDGYSIPPAEFASSFLEAYPVAYGVSSIKWGITLEPVGDVPVPTQTLLVYSPYGPSATISSGTILSESDNNFEYTHADLVGGQWAYYTLFIRYQSNIGDDFYEPAATVEILMPENYGSTNLLWNRIPQYYREQDTSIGELVDATSTYATQELGGLPVGGVVGPLYKFISIFGFEMDKTRTLIDYLMVAKDPSTANTESLDALALTMGIGSTSDVINPSRVRAMLDDIGYLRRTKGTLEGLRAVGRAVSGSEIEIDTDNREITFYSQRVNYITDPLDANTAQCSVSHRPAHRAEVQPLLTYSGTFNPNGGGQPPTVEDEYEAGMYWVASASASSYEGIPVEVGDYIVAYEVNGALTYGVAGYNFSATNYDAYTESYEQDQYAYTTTGTGASVGVDHVMLHIDCPIPVKQLDTVYFSVHSGVGTSALKWVRLVDENGDVIGVSDSLTRAGDSPAGGVVALDNVSADDWTIAFIEVLIDLSAVDTYHLLYLLAERNHLGGYFDGNSRRGGWIVDNTGAQVSDYRWSSEGENSGNTYESPSIYTEEYQRTRALLSDFFATALPVTLSDYYTVVATDAIPGQSAIDTYLTT